MDARGSAQLAGCLKALNTLHKAGRIALPASRGGVGAPTPQRFDAPVAAATAVPGTVEAVAGLSLERVEQGRQRRVWNTLLHFEHPQGTTTFAGCQVRYLVVSAHGVLGAVGFSASALHLRAREAWMGWSDEQRQAHLHRVLCLSRFLIRPGVQCRNLASQVLGQVLARLPADFEARYRYRPWLVETFVGPAHDGASFKAANFVWVGHTAGRGRQDRDHARARPVKSVYMYELEPHWRRRLGVARVDAAPALAPADGLDSAAWTVNEFGGAPLGDQRLSARLVKSAGLLASLPGEAVTANASHDRAAVKGYYRLIDQPVSSAVTPGNILAPHRARTLQRMRGEDTVLCIQDGTDLNFATRPHCEGLGIIGRNQTASKTLGLHLHLTLAVNGAGLPLGVLRCGFEAPPGGAACPADEPPPAAAQETAPKTRRWVDGLRDIDRAAAALSRKTRVLSVMDREADCFAVFDEQRRLNRVEVLVRAHHDRCLAKGAPKLFAAMPAGAADGHVEIEIDRLSARRKSSGRQARPARTGRVARAEVRHRQVVAPPTIAGAEPVALSTVHVRETAPPPGEPAVEWFLLTSLDVDSTETAVAVIGYYLRRWRIEDLFRVLKSGCRVEHLAFHTADRLQRAVTINTQCATPRRRRRRAPAGLHRAPAGFLIGLATVNRSARNAAACAGACSLTGGAGLRQRQGRFATCRQLRHRQLLLRGRHEDLSILLDDARHHERKHRLKPIHLDAQGVDVVRRRQSLYLDVQGVDLLVHRSNRGCRRQRTHQRSQVPDCARESADDGEDDRERGRVDANPVPSRHWPNAGVERLGQSLRHDAADLRRFVAPLGWRCLGWHRFSQ